MQLNNPNPLTASEHLAALNKALSAFPPEEQNEVNYCVNQMTQLMVEFGSNAAMAIMICSMNVAITRGQ